MDIKLFFEITGEFFDNIYSSGLYNDDEKNNEKKDIENCLNSNQDLCYCNVCTIYRELSSFIDTKFFKIQNKNQ